MQTLGRADARAREREARTRQLDDLLEELVARDPRLREDFTVVVLDGRGDDAAVDGEPAGDRRLHEE